MKMVAKVGQWRVWILSLVVFAFIVICYVWHDQPLFDWTGFYGNTVWDWLKLLVVPVALNVAIPFYSGRHEWNPETWSLRTRLIVVVAVLVVLVLIGLGYWSHWDGTGFWVSQAPPPDPKAAPAPEKLWDWLNVLGMPVGFAIAGLQIKRMELRVKSKPEIAVTDSEDLRH